MIRSRLRQLSPAATFLMIGLAVAALLVIVLLAFLGLGAPVPVASASAPAYEAELLPVQQGGCGDGYCDSAYQEDCQTCPDDCGTCGSVTPYCGDGRCDPNGGEDCETCEEDCGSCGGTGFCGDGEVDSDLGEQCDGGGQDECAQYGDNLSCQGCKCQGQYCGDLYLYYPDEQCEPGQLQYCAPGQECNAFCQCETRGPACGNGVIDPGEACDGTDLGQCTTCTPNCTCGGSLCGNGVIDAGEACDGAALGDCVTCFRCQCGGTGPSCGNGIIEAGEACDGAALGDCASCNTDCSCGGTGPFCGNGSIDAGEQCGEPGLVCPGDLVCDTATCVCGPGDPCDPVDEDGEDGGDDPTNNAFVGPYTEVEGTGPSSSTGREDCEEGDCLNPGAGVINTWGGSMDVPTVECCDANGQNCVLHVSAEITYYEAPDGSIQICSSNFDRYCRPGEGDRCIPTTTDDLPPDYGMRVRMTIEEAAMSEVADASSSIGLLASVAPQTISELPITGYVCDEPSDLCVDVTDAEAFTNTIVQDGTVEDYQGLVLWDCKNGEGTEVPVSVINNGYVDQTITVPVGTTVIWTNNDPGEHTVTSDDGQFFNSGPLPTGETFQVTFEIFGEYGYYSQGEGGPNGQGMSGTVIVTPLCVQKTLTLVGTTRACAPCEGDWCGFGPGKPECILVPYNDMPNQPGFDYQGEYDRVENEPEGVGNLSDGVMVLICPAPPQGHICIPVDDQMQGVYENPSQAIGLTDCFSGDPADNVNCPVLSQNFTLETDAQGQDYLCFNAGGDTGFDPSCGPHPGTPYNGCAFSAQGEGGGVVLPAAEGLASGFPLWLLLLILGLLLLILIIFLATRKRGGGGDETLVR